MADGENGYPLSVREQYRVAQPRTWSIDTAKERASLFEFVGAGMKEEDLPEFAATLDRYLAGVLIGIANKCEGLADNATALTGPQWYIGGWREAMRHIEELGWAIDPD
jgi:hypothetical protein